MEAVIVKAQPRSVQGTRPSKRLRKSGWVPGIVYGTGITPESIQVNQHEFEVMLSHHSSERIMVDLDLGSGQPKKVLLKDVQHHPISGHVMHADFQEISMTEKIKIEVPIELVGEAVGTKTQGGVLEHPLRTLAVECLPTDILERVELNIESLHIGENLFVKDIDLDTSKYEVLADPDLAVALVAAPRVEAEPVDEEEEEAAAGAEPEVIGEKKEESEESASE